MPKTKIYLDDPKIKYFTVDNRDKIIDTGDTDKAIWDMTYVEMDKSKMNGNIFISFNKRQNERIGKPPVYTPLNCKIIKIEIL